MGNRSARLARRTLQGRLRDWVTDEESAAGIVENDGKVIYKPEPWS
jgi:hypothetical protein